MCVSELSPSGLVRLTGLVAPISIVWVAGCQGPGSGAKETSQSSSDNKAAQSTSKAEQPEQYHDIDPEKVGFTIVLKAKRFSVNAYGAVVDLDLTDVLVTDMANGGTSTQLILNQKRREVAKFERRLLVC
jgi:hypothetical protein